MDPYLVGSNISAFDRFKGIKMMHSSASHFTPASASTTLAFKSYPINTIERSRERSEVRSWMQTISPTSTLPQPKSNISPQRRFRYTHQSYASRVSWFAIHIICRPDVALSISQEPFLFCRCVCRFIPSRSGRCVQIVSFFLFSNQILCKISLKYT